MSGRYTPPKNRRPRPFDVVSKSERLEMMIAPAAVEAVADAKLTPFERLAKKMSAHPGLKALSANMRRSATTANDETSIDGGRTA